MGNQQIENGWYLIITDRDGSGDMNMKIKAKDSVVLKNLLMTAIGAAVYCLDEWGMASAEKEQFLSEVAEGMPGVISAMNIAKKNTEVQTYGKQQKNQ